MTSSFPLFPAPERQAHMEPSVSSDVIAKTQPSESRSLASKERIRVSRACDRCKKKKIRCTGKKPCTLCNKLNVECEYNARYTRGRLPPVESDSSAQLQTASLRQEPTEAFGSPTSPIDRNDPSARQPMGKDTLVLPEGHGHSSRDPSSRNSPDPTDHQGHFLGPSSGVSYIIRARRRLTNIPSTASMRQASSIFSFGDAPLPDIDSSFFVLPPKERAIALVARYFDFAVPTHRFLHRHTVEGWVESLYSDFPVIPENQADRGKKAVTFMVFAQAQEYMSNSGAENSKWSSRYFQAAENQLRAETGEIQLTSIQARLAQCFYLLSESRINHCWSLFGTTAHLLLALGIHRKRKRDPGGKTDLVDVECRKRVFWAAYTLDNYLSAALGRPRTFHDEDIDQDLPAVISDEEIIASSQTTSLQNKPQSKPQNKQSIMLAPINHIKLSQIISGILRDLYGITHITADERLSRAEKHSSALSRWRKDIAAFLDMESSFLTPLFQRQSNVLKLAYAHAQILVHRPFLLGDFKGPINQEYSSRAMNAMTEENVTQCVEAAMSIVTIVNDLFDGSQLFKAFWFTQYYAFCAIVVLFVYTIQHHAHAEAACQRYFNAAEKCRTQIATLVEPAKDSYAKRYNAILHELHDDVIAKMTKCGPLPPDNGNHDPDRDCAHTILKLSDNHIEEHFSLPLGSHQGNGHPLGGLSFARGQAHMPSAYGIFDNFQSNVGSGGFPQNFSTTSPTGLMDHTTWEDIDSFVATGMGMLDPQDSSMDASRSAERWNITDQRMSGGIA